MEKQTYANHRKSMFGRRTRALAIAALAIAAVLCAAGGARAQSCDAIRDMHWNDAVRHLYAVHAIKGVTVDRLFTPRGTIGSHLDITPIKLSTSGEYPNVEIDFPVRPTLHITWNHLVQSPGPAGNWEDAEIVILEPLQDFDGEMWAATPYDTITLGSHHPGARTVILAKGNTLAGEIRGRISDNPGVTVEAFTGATRDAVDRRLAEIDGLWRLHDAQPAPANLDATDLSKRQKERAHMPVWVTSKECTDGVAILGDLEPRSDRAKRLDPEPQFMTELWDRKLYFGLHMKTAVEALHGGQSDGGTTNGLAARLGVCAATYPGQPDPVEYFFDETEVLKHETIPCSSLVGATAATDTSELVAAHLTCRALRTKDEIVSRTRSDYAWQLATHILTYAIYVDARVANTSTAGLTPTGMGERLWRRVYDLLSANVRKQPSEIASTNVEAWARKACDAATPADWGAYIDKLKPLAKKS